MQQSVAEWFQENQCSQITHDPSADCFIKKVYLRRMRYLECYPELKDLFEQEYQARLVPPWYPNRSPPEFLTKDSVVPMAKNDAVGSSSSQQACSLSFVLVSRLVSGPGDACLNCCLAQLLWKIKHGHSCVRNLLIRRRVVLQPLRPALLLSACSRLNTHI